MSSPKISIITVSFNAGKTIEKTIQSVLSQKYPNLEYIIIDGGSTDNTVEIIEKYKEHFHYWHSKPDKGASVAINIGLERATGDLIGLVFADDYYEANTFSAISKAYLEHHDFDMYSVHTQFVANKNNKLQVLKTFSNPQYYELNLEQLSFHPCMSGSRFVKKALYDDIGNYDCFSKTGEYNFSADLHFFHRCYFNKATNLTVKHMGYSYLSHDGSDTFSTRNIKKMLREHLELIEFFSEEYKLTKKEKNIFKRSYCDRAFRLFARHCLSLDFKNAFNVYFKTLKRCKTYWLYQTITMPFKIIWQKIKERLI